MVVASDASRLLIDFVEARAPRARPRATSSLEARKLSRIEELLTMSLNSRGSAQAASKLSTDSRLSWAVEGLTFLTAQLSAQVERSTFRSDQLTTF